MMQSAAVVIAVETCLDSRIPDVAQAREDARELAAALGRLGVEPARLTVLADAQATCTAIRSHVRRALSGLDRDGVFYLYYAGRGFAESRRDHLVCHDTTLDDPAETSIPLDWLLGQLKASACGRIVVFLDADRLGIPEGAGQGGYGDTADMTGEGLAEFFGAAAGRVCFVSRAQGQDSHRSGTLGHGIWAHHLVQALSGRAPEALETGRGLTAASLRAYLATSVPRTLRATHTGMLAQTPVYHGPPGADLVIADIGAGEAGQEAAPVPPANKLKNVRLCQVRLLPVKGLSGFPKGYRVPDTVNRRTRDFVAEASAPDIEADIDAVRAALLERFAFKRKEIDTSVAPGEGCIITPHFDYEVVVSQDEDNPAQAVYRRQIANIRDPMVMVDPRLEAVFKGVFDTLELVMAGLSFDIESVIDAIEELDDPGVRISYDRNFSKLSMNLEGVDATVTLTRDSFTLASRGSRSPKALIESFLKVQRILVEDYRLDGLALSRPQASRTALPRK